MITDPEIFVLMRLTDSENFDEIILPCTDIERPEENFYRRHSKFLGFIDGTVESDKDLTPLDLGLNYPVIAIHIFWQPSEALNEFNDEEFCRNYSGSWCLFACGLDFETDAKIARFETEEQALEVANSLTSAADIRDWFYLVYW